MVRNHSSLFWMIKQGIGRNLITEHGRVTMRRRNDVMNHTNTQTMYTPKPVMLRTVHSCSHAFTTCCLWIALLKVSTDSAAYCLPSPNKNANIFVSSGACFLKLIITRCTVDTRSTVLTICQTLKTTF